MQNEKSKRLFVSNYDDKKWDRVFEIDREIKEPLNISEIENGIILPLRVREDIKALDEAYEGGVCDENFAFVSGLRRDYVKENANLSVGRSYTVPKDELKKYEETVVFGGILFDHFGHFLTHSTVRVWWHSENPDSEYRFVFLYNNLLQKPGIDRYPEEFFDLIGLPRERILIVQEPSQFKKVIVPEEACYILTRASRKWLLPFEDAKRYVSENLSPSSYRKIYLSRTHYTKYGKCDGINEEYYEKFFERRGYQIIYPEEYSLAQQINILMHAEDIVCTFGSLTHMILFANDGVRHTSIIRTPELWIHQAVINAVRKPDWYWVEGTINPLPTSHDQGYFLYTPTVWFRNYLDSEGIPYEEEELSPALPSKDMVWEYIVNWTMHFSDPSYSSQIKDKTAMDFLRALKQALFGEEIAPEAIRTTKTADALKAEKIKTEELQKQLKEQAKIQEKYKKSIHELIAERDQYKERLEKTQSSVSWKMTKPLRGAHEEFRKKINT